MKTVDFKKLFKSIDEARKIHKGTMKPSRKFVLSVTLVKFSRKEWNELFPDWFTVENRVIDTLFQRKNWIDYCFIKKIVKTIDNKDEIVCKVWCKIMF